jgi:hypothetical protein
MISPCEPLENISPCKPPNKYHLARFSNYFGPRVFSRISHDTSASRPVDQPGPRNGSITPNTQHPTFTTNPTTPLSYFTRSHMASSRFEEIIDGRQPHFERHWADIPYTLQDVTEFLNNQPVSTFISFTC